MLLFYKALHTHSYIYIYIYIYNYFIFFTLNNMFLGKCKMYSLKYIMDNINIFMFKIYFWQNIYEEVLIENIFI